MDFKQITDLIKLINRSNLTEFRLKKGDLEISIRTEKYSKTKTVKSPESSTHVLPVTTGIPAPYPAAAEEKVVTRETAAVPDKPLASEGEEEDLIEIRSPMVGTFYRAPSPDKPPYIKVGDMIGKGTVVCIVEAMKLFNEIESEISGIVVKVIVEDASPVEYDQGLFLVKPV